jgi:hypothetical protein
MFDYTQGYTGTITNAYGVRVSYNVTSDPRGIEGDGNFDGLAQLKQVNQTHLKLTIVSNSVVALSTNQN